MCEKYRPRGRVRIGSQINPGRGDVKLVAIRSAERACGHEIDGEFDHRVKLSVIRSIPVHSLAAPQRHPDAAFRIECDAVPQACFAADRDTWPPSPRPTPSRIL